MTSRDLRAPFAQGALGFVYLGLPERHVFPNATLLFFGDHAELFQVFPGPGVDTSVSMQSLSATTPSTPRSGGRT